MRKTKERQRESERERERDREIERETKTQTHAQLVAHTQGERKPRLVQENKRNPNASEAQLMTTPRPFRSVCTSRALLLQLQRGNADCSSYQRIHANECSGKPAAFGLVTVTSCRFLGHHTAKQGGIASQALGVLQRARRIPSGFIHVRWAFRLRLIRLHSAHTVQREHSGKILQAHIPSLSNDLETV